MLKIHASWLSGCRTNENLYTCHVQKRAAAVTMAGARSRGAGNSARLVSRPHEGLAGSSHRTLMLTATQTCPRIITGWLVVSLCS